ncbi:hypothetical protein ACOM2C_10780 [Pseudarthrobacter sp. So.54]
MKLLDALDTPAIIVGRGTAVVASNAAHQALTIDCSQQPPGHRYYAYWPFAEPAAPEILVDAGNSGPVILGRSVPGRGVIGRSPARRRVDHPRWRGRGVDVPA